MVLFANHHSTLQRFGLRAGKAGDWREGRPVGVSVGVRVNRPGHSFYLSIGHPISAVCIRTSTERPEALDKGCFVLSGIDTKGLLQSVDVAVSLIRDGLPGIPVPDYVDENVSTKVVRIIQSYVGVVNKMVWRKF